MIGYSNAAVKSFVRFARRSNAGVVEVSISNYWLKFVLRVHGSNQTGP